MQRTDMRGPSGKEESAVCPAGSEAEPVPGESEAALTPGEIGAEPVPGESEAALTPGEIEAVPALAETAEESEAEESADVIERLVSVRRSCRLPSEAR
ncbi:MAG: hypothetical protein Q4C60_10420 [Eubacteriales bacterium]|nr:hypothetical protein [Eubacteriales bacterium]